MLRALVLLSGGIDSTVVLAYALAQKRQCIALSFDYGQRHRIELESAQQVAAYYQVNWQVVTLPSSPTTASALLSSAAAVPQDRSRAAMHDGGIPSTYVPARNTLFLAHALAQAEILTADEIYFGANADDCNAYPDCRPAFFAAFQTVAQLGTRHGVTQGGPYLHTPLLYYSKRDIVTLGRTLKAPLDLTFSCYAPDSHQQACMRCDACLLRQDALMQA